MAQFTKMDPMHMIDTTNLVQVFNISPNSTEKKITDFFQYCGSVIEYEIVPVENGFEALLLFDKLSSVETALLLNNSRIDDRNVIVKKYDDVVKESIDKVLDTETSNTTNDKATPATTIQQSKIVQFLAEGLAQAEHLSKNIDNKFHVTEKFQTIYDGSVKITRDVDTKLGISDKTSKASTAVNSKIEELHIKEKWNDAKNAAQPRVVAAKNIAQPTVNTITNSTPVKKFQEIINQVRVRVNEVTNETKKLKDEKIKALNPEVENTTEQPAVDKTENVSVNPTIAAN